MIRSHLSACHALPMSSFMDHPQTEEPSVRCPICGSTNVEPLEKVLSLPTHQTVQCQCGAVFTYRLPKAREDTRRESDRKWGS